MQFIFPSRESDQCARRARVGVVGHLCSVYHSMMGESRLVPFPMAQQVNLPACSPHSSVNAERRAGSCKY